MPVSINVKRFSRSKVPAEPEPEHKVFIQEEEPEPEQYETEPEQYVMMENEKILTQMISLSTYINRIITLLTRNKRKKT